MAGKDGRADSEIPEKPPMISPLEDAASVGGLCSSHPGEPLAIYCRTCLQLICTECMDDAHELHKLKSVRKQLPVLKEEIAQTLPTLKTRVTGQKAKLEQLNATIKREEKEFATELEDREEQQREYVAQLEAQYRKLQEELEMHFRRKKDALKEHMTLGYKKQMTSQIEELTAARDQLMTECEDLDNIIADYRLRINSVEWGSKDDSRVADQGAADDLEFRCDHLSVSEVIALLPKLKSLSESDPTSLPDERLSVPPLSVPEKMKKFYARLTKDAAGFRLHVQELLEPTAGNTGVAFSHELVQSFKALSDEDSITHLCSLAADSSKAYKYDQLKLTTVSEEAGKELARLCGGGDVLVRETRHNGEVLRTATGTVTHVRAYAYSHHVRAGYRQLYWLPAGLSVVEAARLAGYTCNTVNDTHSSEGVTNTNVLAWFDSSLHCCFTLK